MTTYQELQRELERLHQQAQRTRLAEKSAALARIKALIDEYQLTPADLGFASGTGGKTGAVAPKYRDPVSGATWSGRGRSPKWLEGKDRSEFAID
jgi:DNA-binding protein H-NS